jgi:hypothetical protein
MLDRSTSEVCLPTVSLPHQAYTNFRHQIDALGFMTDREIGKLLDPMRYWRSGTDEDGTLVYVILYVSM